MMRWFGGGTPGGAPTVPVGARLIWTDPLLWVAGNWAQEQVRTLEGSGARLAVIGTCSASGHDLERALASRDIAPLARSWAGSHTVVRATVAGALEILTDAAGACPVYTVKAPGGPVWGSSSLALSTLTGRRVDTGWLAAFLRDRHTPVPGRSAWVGVEPVPAGHLLTLRPDGEASLSVSWSVDRRHREGAFEALRRALAEGVRVRVEGVTVTTDLAGMDSTTLALLATRHGHITGVTAHPAGDTDGGDLRYARLLDAPGLDRLFFSLGARHLPFTEAEMRLPATDEPAPSTAVWAMFSAQLRRVAAVGSARHLTGDGGDNLFLPPPAHLVDLARRGHLLRMISDAMDWARLRKQSPRPLISAALRGDVRQLGRPERPRPAWLRVPVPSCPVVGGDADALLVASLRSVARAAHADVQLSDSLGIELHNPYFDAAVLDAVVSVSARERWSAHRYKPVLQDAFADVLPDTHRRRAAKGLFAADFHRGLRTNLRRVLRLADGRLAALGIIDPAPLRATIHAACLGAQTIWPPLLSVLAAEEWLEAMDTEPSTTWTAPPSEGAR
ncbi:albusnodin/ikarugamycin family macrolactam cyclase [Streptomyces sp. URMC 129]|uniref:albusnodin/ikarugamycin family macrolactam cyclase n=1 Tax=Streptomyces sp. URMC 129 TaxID=3423407 RepID=UPI003F1D0B43